MRAKSPRRRVPLRILDGLAVNEDQFDRVTDKIRAAAGGDLSAAPIACGSYFKRRTGVSRLAIVRDHHNGVPLADCEG